MMLCDYVCGNPTNRLEEEKNNGKNSRSQRRQFNPEVEAF